MDNASLQSVLTKQKSIDGNSQQRKVLHRLMQCQTAALDGYEMRCHDCGQETVRYHSCRDRHCPRCGFHAQQRWGQRMQAVALPVTYYHVVFTLPHSLNGWVQRFPKVIYQCLFHCVWATMHQFGQDKKRLHGEIGMSAVLHTWGQQLNHHVHLHCLVPGGALTEKGQWRAAKSNYLFPVKALSKVYRGKMVSALRRLVEKGDIHDSRSADLLKQLMQHSWNVYSKPCIQKTETVIKYLARYSHRVALNDSRLIAMDDERIALKYKDYRDNKRKVLQLTHGELIQRFKKHILPYGLMRIRHYGFMSNRCRKQTRAKILAALEQVETKMEEPSEQKVASASHYYCPICGSMHVHVGPLMKRESG